MLVMKRKMVSAVTLTLLLTSMITLAFNIKPVQAEPALITILHTLGFTNIAGSTLETFSTGTYNITLYAEFSGYHLSNELSWYIVGTAEYNLLFSGPEGYFGYISPPIVKTFMADGEFGLSFLSPEARYFTETARNPDSTEHAMIFVNLDNPAMFLLGFENTLGGGDRDYQDMVVSLELVTPPPPPLSVSISPLSASILVGQSVTFTSTVSGGYTPYGYQWYLNGAPVPGATSNTWIFTPTASEIYYVYLKVTDAKGNTAQSETARVTVTAVPVGGYSFPIQVTTKTEPVLPYIALIATLTAIFIKLRPKTKRKHRQ
jgi:hypothetical protein